MWYPDGDPPDGGLVLKPKGADRERIMALLDEAGGLTPEHVRAVSQETGIPEADVYGVATFYTLIARPNPGMRVCGGLSCRVAGAQDVLDDLTSNKTPHEIVSCLGQCDRAPVALDTERNLVAYAPERGGITPANDDLPMNLAGEDDASYSALAAARTMGSEKVVAELRASGLQGRGGAGFPAAIKWAALLEQAETERYVVCNADEGEPGTFKDREIMLRRPHLMLEGLAIAAHTIQTPTILIYIRGEFSAERQAVERAIAEASEALRDFDFQLVDGHGAYICGEETALLEALEGRRGLPRLKPPYPTESGYRGKPTLMNNVETLACVPPIMLRGGDWFKAQGRTEPGSKLYCVSGHVKRPGVYELPLGVGLDELVEASGGYLGTPKAFSPGGASSGFLPMSFREEPLDFGHLAKAGSMLGSAGVVVLNDTINMAWAALEQAIFFEEESCGQCAPCRIGTRVVRRALDQYTQSGSTKHLEYLDDVAWEMEAGSICGLGMTAGLPLQSARKYFPEDFSDCGAPTGIHSVRPA